MIKRIASIAEVLTSDEYGGKAAGLSRMKRSGFNVPDAIAIEACDEAEYRAFLQNELLQETLANSLAPFRNDDGLYAVAVRSSSPNEDSQFESFAGHLQSCLGTFTFLELLGAVDRVFQHGIAVLHARAGRLGIVIQRLVHPKIAGVCFSSNPLTTSRGELVISFGIGLADRLVGGTAPSTSFVLCGDVYDDASNLIPDTLSHRIASRLFHDVHALEDEWAVPLDVEWCCDGDDLVHYVQCRPITTIAPTNRGLIPVKSAHQARFPSIVANHDKIAIRIACEEHGTLISNAYLHVVYDRICAEHVDLNGLVASPDCVSFSAVLVHPRRLGGKIIRRFAKPGTTAEICEDRGCIRYAARDLATQDDLTSSLVDMHTAALEASWVSIIIIQEIFEPFVTGVLMQVDSGFLIEVAYGHFVPKGVVPTSWYLVDEDGNLLQQKEVTQNDAYFIENGAAIARRLDQLISISPAVLKNIVQAFRPLAIQRRRALEFGVLRTHNGLSRPYLIDLVDVSADGEPVASLIETGVLSQGKITGRLVHLSRELPIQASLDAHLLNQPSPEIQAESGRIVYHAARPDIALISLLNIADASSIGFVFDEGTILCHLAILLREKRIPAVISASAAKHGEGVLVILDAISEGLTSEERVGAVEQKVVFSYKNPDADGVIGSFAFCFLRASYGDTFQAVHFGGTDAETQFICKTCGLQLPRIVRSIDRKASIALIDTHHVSQLPIEIDLQKVVEIVDHHPGGNPEAFPNAKIINEPVGAACTLIAEQMIRMGIVPPISLARAMGFAIASNTLNFGAPSTTDRDRNAFAWLGAIAQVSSEDIASMLRARSSLGEGGVYEILAKNQKKFVIHGCDVLVSQIEMPAVGILLDNLATETGLAQLKQNEGAKYAVVSLVDPLRKTTIIRVADTASEALISLAMSVQFNSRRAEVNRILLRKTDFVPRLEECLAKGKW